MATILALFDKVTPSTVINEVNTPPNVNVLEVNIRLNSVLSNESIVPGSIPPKLIVRMGVAT